MKTDKYGMETFDDGEAGWNVDIVLTTIIAVCKITVAVIIGLSAIAAAYAVAGALRETRHTIAFEVAPRNQSDKPDEGASDDALMASDAVAALRANGWAYTASGWKSPGWEDADFVDCIQEGDEDYAN